MALINITNGTPNDADEVMDNFDFVLTNLLNYALDGATTTNQDNIKVDLFGSDTATNKVFMSYNAGTDLYECDDTSAVYYVVIEATSLTTSAFEINDCNAGQLTSGKYLVWCISGTYEVNRAKVLQTLFENGASSPLITDATSITAIKTPDSDDEGLNGHYIFIDAAASGTADITGTFADTSTNLTSCSWSKLVCPGTVGTWQMPSGTTLNNVTAGTSDEFGTDRSADEKVNPATCKITMEGISSDDVKAIIFCKGSISWVETNVTTGVEYDFATPAFTATTESDLTCILVTGTKTISSSDNNVIIKSVHTLTVGNTLTTEVSFNGGTNYTTVTQKQLTAITNTGTTAQVRFTITRATNTETDSITSYAYYHGASS